MLPNMLFHVSVVLRLQQQTFLIIWMEMFKGCKSGRHTQISDDKDLQQLVKKALEVDIFTEHAQRSYKQFFDIKRDRLENFDTSNMFKWINKHKNNIVRGIRAR